MQRCARFLSPHLLKHHTEPSLRAKRRNLAFKTKRLLRRPSLQPPRNDCNVYVGVDRGGTWTRVIAINTAGRSVHFSRFPSQTLTQLPSQLKKLFRHCKIDPLGIAVASRGVWAAAKRKTLKRALAPLAKRIQVISDVEAAWLAAFGHLPKTNKKRVVLIAGTGSIALTQDAKGQWKRAGGLGPEKGDEGSAYWIGKQWLSPKLKGEGVAMVAPIVIRLAERGNTRAIALLQDAYRHLLALLPPLIGKESAQVYRHGGLFTFPFFKRGFEREARQQKWRISWVRSKVSAEIAAARQLLG